MSAHAVGALQVNVITTWRMVWTLARRIVKNDRDLRVPARLYFWFKYDYFPSWSIDELVRALEREDFA